MRITSPAIDCPHGFFTREGGVSTGIFASLNCGPGSGDDIQAVAENRRRVAQTLGDGTLCTLHQIHSNEVVTVREAFSERPKADALVTDRPGLILGVLTADCGPVLFCDAKAQVIGAAHAGWKGALSGVLENTLAAMEALGARRERIAAAIGPCIAQDSYEVGAEFYQTFVETNALYGTFFRRSQSVAPANAGVRMPSYDGMTNKYYFDLPGFIAHRLAQSGLQRMDRLAMDTYADAGRFFSYRRSTHAQEPDYGRQISAITMMR